MGKQQNSFGGGFSGRLGATVGYNWRGRWCVRSLPGDFHDARSDAQLRQRKLFAEMVRFAAKARRILSISLEVVSRNEGVTPSNYFTRMNKGCFSIQDGELAVDLPSLRLSEGPVAPVAFDVPQLLDDTTISIAFEKNPLNRNCSADDQIYLVAYCPEYKSFDFSDATARRRKQAVLQLNEGWVGKEVHLWGFVVDRAGRASQSVYIGSGVLDFSTVSENADNESVGLADDPFVDEQTGEIMYDETPAADVAASGRVVRPASKAVPSSGEG